MIAEELTGFQRPEWEDLEVRRKDQEPRLKVRRGRVCGPLSESWVTRSAWCRCWLFVLLVDVAGAMEAALYVAVAGEGCGWWMLIGASLASLNR